MRRGYSRRNRSRSPLFSSKFRRQQGNYPEPQSDRRRIQHSRSPYDDNVEPFSSNERYEGSECHFYGEGPSWQMHPGDGEFNYHDYSHEDSGYSSSLRFRLGDPPLHSNSSNYEEDAYGKKRVKSIVRMKEFVNEDILIMELSEISPLGHYSPIFVHRSSLFFPRGDNSGYCDRFADYPGLKMSEFFKLGQLYNFEGEETEKDCILELLALKVWPSDCQEPQTLDESLQRDHFRSYLSKFDRCKLTFATLPTVTGTRMSQARAHVSKIVTDKYGIIEVRGLKKDEDMALKCLFHYDSVWLENGDNARDALGYTKVLNDLVHVGMDVNVTARSIIKAKGQDIVQSKLELQAILVFVKPFAMPASMPKATRIRGPPGSIGYSRRYTPYFFNSSLLYTLNSQLSEFINITKEIDPMIERSYLNPSVDLELLLNNKDRRLKRDSFGQIPSVRMDIIGSKGRIICLFDDEDGGVIECVEGGEKCFFSRDNVFKRSGDVLREICAYGSLLSFNASLIDLHSKVPYLASEVWNEEHFPPREHKPDLDQGLLERFKIINKNLPEDFLCPQNAENASGVVYRILDDNFGLLQWDRNNKLTLFDTCDLWLDDNVTAEKVKKSLKDVIKVNQPLRFHALLINKDSKIPYLTSAIWDPRNTKLRNYPPFVDRGQIHSKKISIYNVVLKSVVEKLFPKDPNERIGRVSSVLTLNSIPVAGISYGENNSRNCFFEIDGNHQNFRTGSRVKYILKSDSECPLSLAINVSDPNVDFPPSNKSNEKESIQKVISRWKELNLDAKEWSRRSLPSSFEVPCRGSEIPAEDEANSACLICMINKDSGILRNNYDSSKLCYFEVEDINLEFMNESITLKDLGTLLGNEIPGIRVCYQSTRPLDCPSGEPIQYIANVGGVQVTATSPLPSFIKLKEAKKSYEKDLRTSKISRWRYANQVYVKNEAMPLENILRGEYPSRGRESTLILPALMIASRGHVRHILNENFGIVQESRSGAYCLFDTYDLYVSPRMSATETNQSVRDVVQIGEEVEFNATLVRNLKKIPYLVTGLWSLGLSDQMAHIQPVSLDTIQSDKIDVYDTVSDSCAKMVQMRSEEVDTRQILERKKYIQKAYSSESYIKYISSLPKERRSSRDPSTPQPEFCDDDPNDLIRWRENIVDWLSEQLNRNSYEQSSSSSRGSHFQPEILNDEDTIGKLYTADDMSDFGIIRLDNGAKALVHRERVWLTNRPLSSNTDLGILIRKEFFRQIHVKARRLSPALQAECGVEYQVIYCHAGTKMSLRGSKFDYGSNLNAWIDSLKNGNMLEREIESYLRVLVNNRMNR